MRYLIFQNWFHKIRKCLVTTKNISVTALMLIFIYGCTGHENPFDPENENTKGVPFNLEAKPYFCKITLEWDPLKLHDRDGDSGTPMDIDFYQIYKKKGNENWSKLDSTREISYEDTAVVNGIEYSYKVTAWRGNKESDPSRTVSIQAFWYPNEIDEVNSISEPVDIAFCSSCNRSYVIYKRKDFVVILDQNDQQIGDPIKVGDTPMGVNCWHDETTGRDTLLVCNKRDKSLSVFTEISFDSFAVIDTIPLEGSPLSVEISKSRREAFVSFDDIKNIEIIDLNELVIKDNILDVGTLKRLLLVNESGPLLGVNYNKSEVVVVDIESGKVKYTIKVEEGPNDIAVVLGTNLAYVTCDRFLNPLLPSRTCAIDFESGLRILDREIVYPVDEVMINFPTSVAIFPKGFDDGLLFIAVYSSRLGNQATRIFGYHIGPRYTNLIKKKIIYEPFSVPRLVRALPDFMQKKLYILHKHGIHSYH